LSSFSGGGRDFSDGVCSVRVSPQFSLVQTWTKGGSRWHPFRMGGAGEVPRRESRCFPPSTWDGLHSPGRPCVDALRTARTLPRAFPFSAQFAPFGGGATAESSLGMVFSVPASRIGPTGPKGLNSSNCPGLAASGGAKSPIPPAFVGHPVLRGLAGAHFMIGCMCSGANRLRRRREGHAHGSLLVMGAYGLGFRAVRSSPLLLLHSGRVRRAGISRSLSRRRSALRG
jgi:hypothetical protein